MKIIVVSETTYALVANAAIAPFVSTGRQLPSGQWEVPISDTVYQAIIEAQLEGETIDDTILRLLIKERH